MPSNKAEIITENTAIAQAPAEAKTTVNRAVKRVAKKSVNTTDVSATPKLKIKIVRDFSMPQVEYQNIAKIKDECQKAGLHAKKSEILRAGLKVLSEMSREQIIRIIVSLPKTKVALHS